MIRIAIIVGSTRPGRKADAVARWAHGIATRRGNAEFDIVDLADFRLPHLDEPSAAAKGPHYTKEHTKTWADTIASYDGYVFVTPEYNHAITGALKNAIDFLYIEWQNKAAGFVSYGLHGGVRAVEQLRLIMGELQVADVRSQVALSLFSDFDGEVPNPASHHEQIMQTMLDQVVAWSRALKALRPQAVARV